MGIVCCIVPGGDESHETRRFATSFAISASLAGTLTDQVFLATAVVALHDIAVLVFGISASAKASFSRAVATFSFSFGLTLEYPFEVLFA